MNRFNWNFLIVLILLFLNLHSPSAFAATESIPYAITVTATVGEPKLTLFGYTSPQAEVKLEGERVHEETIANEEGYFFFDRIFLPPPTPDYPEICLTAIDTHYRTSFPTCLPPLPVGPFDITVGPVLLPPTISLEKGNFLPNEQIVAEGETIPNTEATIYLANDFWTKTPHRLLSIFRASPAYAYYLPRYQIQADERGHFEFNLPGVRPASWRVFAATNFLGSPTPKSNSLSFKVLSWWEWFWQMLKRLLSLILGFLRPYLWQLIILAEVVLIFWLWRKRRLSKADSHALR